MDITLLYTVAQMQEAERRAETEYGIPLASLMDNAAFGLMRTALDMLPKQDGVMGIFCGSVQHKLKRPESNCARRCVRLGRTSRSTKAARILCLSKQTVPPPFLRD